MDSFADAFGAAARPWAAVEEEESAFGVGEGGSASSESFAGLAGGGALAEAVADRPGEHQALRQQYVSSAAWPWSAVVEVVMTFPNGIVYAGSGVMVGRNDVLTAAHLVYEPAWGGYASSVLVVPASDPALLFNGPYGSSPATIAQADIGFYSGSDLIAEGDRGPGLAGSERDVAFLTLQWPLGDQTGWMALDPTFKAGYANLSGYTNYYGRHLTNDVALAFDDPVDAFTDIGWFEAHPGNSGGPVWHYDSAGRPAVVAIVSSGDVANGRGAAAFDVATSYGSILGWIASNDSLLA